MTTEAANALAPLAMAGFVALAFVFDAWLPRHRAILASLLTGFLFLPSVEYDLGGLLNWNRITAPVLVIWAGILLRDHALLRAFRLRAWDLPILLWCLAPGISSLSNGFGAYDAVAAVFYQSVLWAGPYFIGRLHFRTRAQAFDLAWALLWGCLVYVPLCWLEIMLSPQLHLRFYGFQQHDFFQSIRGSFYRPVVFLQHGLMVAMWLFAGALLAWCLHRTQQVSRVFKLPVVLLAVGLAVTLLAAQSAGATVLFLIVGAAWWVAQRMRSHLPLLALALLPALWIGARATELLSTQSLTQAATRISADRAQSLEFRLSTEDLLIEHARERPLFGWSSWSRDRVIERDYAEETLIVDGLWVIALSQNGYFGLLTLLAVHLVPVLILMRRQRAREALKDRELLLLFGFAYLLAITMVDHLFNAMVTPYAILLLGALPTLAAAWRPPELVDGAGMGAAAAGANAGAQASAGVRADGPRVLGG